MWLSVVPRLGASTRPTVTASSAQKLCSPSVGYLSAAPKTVIPTTAQTSGRARIAPPIPSARADPRSDVVVVDIQLQIAAEVVGAAGAAEALCRPRQPGARRQEEAPSSPAGLVPRGELIVKGRTQPLEMRPATVHGVRVEAVLRE